MRKKILTSIAALFCCLCIFAQNPYNYQTKVVTIAFSRDGAATYAVLSPAEVFKNGQKRIGATNQELNTLMQTIISHYNNLGYRLASTNFTFTNLNQLASGAFMVLYFEKSDSYREKELYKMISELTTRIDTTSKRYTDSAMRNINTAVLNYLKNIPNDVLTVAYKDQMTEAILTQVRKEYDAVIEDLRKQVRQLSNK